MSRRPIRLAPELIAVGAIVTLVWSAAFGVAISGFVVALLTGNGLRWHLDGIVRMVTDGASITYGVPSIVVVLGAVIIAAALALAILQGIRRATKVSDDWRQDDRERRISKSPVWAKPKDIPTLIEPAPVSRVVLGELAGETVAARREHSVIVVAPPRSGKTVSVVVPAVLRWEGPAIVTSTKRDVYDVTQAHRATLGPVWVFDPAGVTGTPSAKWSPIPGCEDWIMAEDVAHWLVQAARVQDSADRASFWETQARQFLAPLLHAAALDGRHADEVLEWVQRGLNASDDVLAPLTHYQAHDALLALNSAYALPAETFGGVQATALNLFHSYGSARMRPFTSFTPGDPDAIDWDDLIDNNGTLYLLASDSDQQLLRPVFEAMLASMMRKVADRYLTSSSPLNPRLLLMLDEAAHVASPLRLPEWLNSYSGQGVNVVTVWQDLAQIEEIYGPARARAVWTGHPAKLLLGGISDTSTLVAARDLIGDQATGSRTESWSPNGDVSTSEADGDLDVAPVAWLRRRPAGTAIGLVAEHKPMQLNTLPWYADPALVDLVPADVREAQARQAR